MANISDKASEQLKNLTQSEAWELIRQIELKFGVRPAALSGGVVVSSGFAGGTVVHCFAHPPGLVARAVVLPPRPSFTLPSLKVRGFVQEGITTSGAEVAKIQPEDLVSKVTVSEIENRNLAGESVITGLSNLDNSETLIHEIDNLLDDISGSDERIKTNQASIDSLKIETKEMLAALYAMID